MSRNRFVVIMAVVAAMLLGTINTVLAQGNVLTVWADDVRAPLILELVDDVEADLGIQLEVVELAFGDIRDQLLVAGPVGEGPDIILGPHDWLGQLVSNGAVLPIDLSDYEDQILDVALNAFTVGGETYALPYQMENVALIRNTDLVAEAPATWEEVRAVSEQLQADGEADYGFLIQTGNPYHNFGILSAFGGYIFGRNDDGSFNAADIGWDSEGSLAAAEWLSSMYIDGVMVSNVDDDVVWQLFGDEELAMFVTGPWDSNNLTESGINYSIDPIPGSEAAGIDNGTPFLGAQGFWISAFSENQLLAEIFLLDYVTNPEFLQRLWEADPRIPVWESVDASADPNVEGFVAAGQNAVPMPSIPEMSAVWGAAGNALTLVSQGEDPVAAFNTATTQIVEAIEIANSEEIFVGIPGSYQAAAGCPGDWLPDCAETQMALGDDGLYTLTVTLPAGDYEYKVAIGGTWDENYGADGVRDGDNLVLSLSEETEVTFTYDPETNVITDSVNN